MKRCAKCGEVKLLDDFHRNHKAADGRQNHCKSCAAMFNRAWRIRNPEVARAHSRRFTERHPDVKRANRQREKREKREAFLARKTVYNHVKQGTLTKPDACPRCGTTERVIHAHHADYSKPLEVEWLCARCHAELHHPLTTTGGTQ